MNYNRIARRAEFYARRIPSVISSYIYERDDYRLPDGTIVSVELHVEATITEEGVSWDCPGSKDVTDLELCGGFVADADGEVIDYPAQAAFDDLQGDIADWILDQ